MSLLANALAPYLAGRSNQEIADLTQDEVGRETIRRMVDGTRNLKFSSLKALRKALKLSDEQWSVVLCAWIKCVIGDDASRVIVEPNLPAGRAQKVRDKEADQLENAAKLFRALPPKDREQIVLVMQRPRVLDCLPPINALLTQ